MLRSLTKAAMFYDSCFRSQTRVECLHSSRLISLFVVFRPLDSVNWPPINLLIMSSPSKVPPTELPFEVNNWTVFWTLFVMILIIVLIFVITKIEVFLSCWCGDWEPLDVPLKEVRVDGSDVKLEKESKDKDGVNQQYYLCRTREVAEREAKRYGNGEYGLIFSDSNISGCSRLRHGTPATQRGWQMPFSSRCLRNDQKRRRSGQSTFHVWTWMAPDADCKSFQARTRRKGTLEESGRGKADRS